jgi:L-asparaginase/Glu-tRNA(Gln) amidotransferase subunit D
VSGTQNQALDYAAEKGVFIVSGTRSGAGRIAPAPPRPTTSQSNNGNQSPSPAQQRRRQFTIAAEDHAPLKARVLLMLALSTTTDRGEIQRMFTEY